MLHPRPLYGLLERVVIKSDSAYVVRGVTEWMYKWTWNGYIDSEGHCDVNEHLGKIIKWQSIALKREVWLLSSGNDSDAMAKSALKFPANRKYSWRTVCGRIDDYQYFLSQ